MNTCTACGITDENVLHYYQKVGGSDQPVEHSHCKDAGACMKRVEAFLLGKAEIKIKHPHFFED